MGYQSAVLGYEFGVNYELGKRTVKSMPNDLFNKIRSGSDEEISVVYKGQEYKMKYYEYLPFLSRQHSQEMITNFRNALPDAMSVQRDVIDGMVGIESLKAKIKPELYVKIILAVKDGIAELKSAGATDDQLINFLIQFFFGGSYWGNNLPTLDPAPEQTEPPPPPFYDQPKTEPTPTPEPEPAYDPQAYLKHIVRTNGEAWSSLNDQQGNVDLIVKSTSCQQIQMQGSAQELSVQIRVFRDNAKTSCDISNAYLFNEIYKEVWGRYP